MRLIPSTLPGLALLACATAFAQTAPNAGTLLQQIEKDRLPALPSPSATPSAAPQPLQALPGPTVTVSAFRFVGNTLLTDADLAPAVTGLLGRPLDFAQLQQAPMAVADAYRRAGWVIRAYLPRQEIHDGVVTIQIVEAVFGGARLESPARRVTPEQVLAIVDAAQAKGAPLNADAVDRALLLADDLPGVIVSGNLAAGSQERETDLVLSAVDEPLLSGRLDVDNAGSRSTGATRLNGSLALASVLGRGDQTTANLIHSEGSDYLRLGFTLPAGSGGWRVGGSGSSLDYRLISADFNGLNAKGNSSTVGLEATYPLLRARFKNLYLGLNYDHKRFDNRSAGAVTTRYGVDSFSASLNGNLFDNLGGANMGSLALVSGRVDLAGSPNRAADAATTRSAGDFTKLRYSLTRQQVLGDRLSLFAAVSGQSASKNLDSSEKFYLGGASGVRAYPANEGGGSEGTLANLELRARLPGTLTNLNLSGFYDWGQVTVNRNNAFPGAAALNRYQLKGAGFALSWLAANGVSLKATWARRIGDNPNPTATGRDQDGSLTRDRVWLEASLAF